MSLIIGYSTDLYKRKLDSEDGSAEMRSCLVGLFAGSFCLITMQVCTLISSLPLQYFAMFMRVAANVCFFTGSNAFVSAYFPQEKFCTLYGAVACVQAVILASQSLLVLLLEGVLEGEFFYLNLGLTVLSFLSLAQPVFILVKTRKGEN